MRGDRRGHWKKRTGQNGYWKRDMKKIGNARMRAQTKVWLHKIKKKDIESLCPPALKVAANPWHWD